MSSLEKARSLSARLPEGGLFAGEKFLVSPDPFPISKELYDTLEQLGPVLHRFYRAANTIYRHSVQGDAPSWVAEYLDKGKPAPLIEAARRKRLNGQLPEVIRPDLILTDDGFILSELDSVPGGVGLTGFLNRLYAEAGDDVIGGRDGMSAGFRSILSKNAEAGDVSAAIVVSEEAKTYRPEMEWIAAELAPSFKHLRVASPEELSVTEEGVFVDGRKLDVIYRFFELFDLPQIAHGQALMESSAAGLVRITPPFKPVLEEKMWFALFRHPALTPYWRRELGDRDMQKIASRIPHTIVMDPTPLPPHAIIPDLQIHEWREMKDFSQKQRDWLIKISGFSELAWGSRGVHYGSDLPAEEWHKAIDTALESFPRNPYLIQKFHHSKVYEVPYMDPKTSSLSVMHGRVRLCPYYFVQGEKTVLSGILATICPADKKILHGMDVAILAPCRIA